MADQIKPNRKAHMRRGIWIMLSVALLVTVGTILALTEDTADVTQANAPPALQSFCQGLGCQRCYRIGCNFCRKYVLAGQLTSGPPLVAGL